MNKNVAISNNKKLHSIGKNNPMTVKQNIELIQ